jgi:hypothetical protein
LNADAVATLETTQGRRLRWCFTVAGKRIQQSATARDRAKQRAGIIGRAQEFVVPDT